MNQPNTKLLQYEISCCEDIDEIILIYNNILYKYTSSRDDIFKWLYLIPDTQLILLNLKCLCNKRSITWDIWYKHKYYGWIVRWDKKDYTIEFNDCFTCNRI